MNHALLSEYRLLLVQETPDVQRWFAAELQAYGAEVTLECNGPTAVEQVLRAARRGIQFHAVLFDIDHPLHEGLTAVRLLRMWGQKLPIIVTAAEPAFDQWSKWLAAGCSHCLVKTTSPDVLARAINAQRTPRQSSAIPTRPARLRFPDPVRMLLS